nr:hypothetical protein [Bacillus velezensis]
MSGIPAYANGTKKKKKQGILSTVWNGAKAAASKVKDLALDVFSYISNPSKLINKVIEKLGLKMPNFAGFAGILSKGHLNLSKTSLLILLKTRWAMLATLVKAGRLPLKSGLPRR